MFTTVDMRKLQDRLNEMSEVVNEEMDKGDMHDTLGDAMIAMSDAAQHVRAVSDEIEKNLYTDESVEEAPIENSNGDAELAELKDMLGRSGVMGFSQ